MSADDEFSIMLDEESSPTRMDTKSQSRDVEPAADPKQPPGYEAIREDALRQELASVKKVNEAIEGVLQSLQKAKSNIKTVNNTASSASQLLNMWTRILSQTEHNQRLILDPSWQGATQDIADIEDEEKNKQFESERREIEEQERKVAAAQKVEDDERRRTDAAARASKPVRGRVRGLPKGPGHVSSAATPTPSTGNASMLRAPSTSRGRTISIGRARGLRGKS